MVVKKNTATGLVGSLTLTATEAKEASGAK